MIDTMKAGKGTLSVAVKAGGTEIEHSITDLGKGQFDVSFVPLMTIPHKLEVKFNNLVVRNVDTVLKVRKELRMELIKHVDGFIIRIGHRPNERQRGYGFWFGIVSGQNELKLVLHHRHSGTQQ